MVTITKTYCCFNCDHFFRHCGDCQAHCIYPDSACAIKGYKDYWVDTKEDNICARHERDNSW